MPWKRHAIALFTACLLAACGGGGNGNGSSDNGPPTEFDPFADTGMFLNILPPGQADSNTGGQEEQAGNNPHFDDQLTMYEALSFTQPGELETVDDLVPTYYKRAEFRAEDSFESVRTITDGTHTARIARDEFGVPHIFGDTRADVYFGTGYVSGHDRLFLMDALRHVGRGRLSDFAGATGGNYSQDRGIGLVAGYDEAEIQAQIEQLARRFGETGEQIIADNEAFAAGINTYIGDLDTPEGEPTPVEYAAILQDGPVPFTPRDVLGVSTLVQATFAVGGGSEHRQVQLLHALDREFDTETACQLWRDLRHFDDPEKPVTTVKTFRTQSPPDVDENACPLRDGFAGDFPGAAVFDPDSLQTRDILAIEDCFTPNVDCPDYRGTVVDDDPDNGDGGSNRQGNAPPPARAPGSSDIELDLDGFGQLALSQRILDDSAIGRTLAYLDRYQRYRPELPVPYRDARRPRLLTVSELAEAQASVSRTLSGLRLALSEDRLPKAMSNAILVNADQTRAGHPIAVFGPQTGYFVPQLLLEFSQQGGGVNVRGMSFAGIPYVLIGRGVDHAWSATSAGADIIDIRVLKLCDAGADSNNDLQSDFLPMDGYRRNGTCEPFFERIDEWTAEYHAAALPPTDGSSTVGQAVTRTILRAPDYGPVFAKATVDGQLVALARQRSTFFGEVDSAVPFVAISRNKMTDPQSFNEVFNSLTGTFNWFYIDAENIAYFNSGLLPKRADGVHPDLPQWGTGDFDWAQTTTGRINFDFNFDNFLPLEAHPRESNPDRGYFANWNNAQAPGFWANDGQNDYGAVDRSQMLERRLIRFQNQFGGEHTPATMVEIMADAAHIDLRGQEIVREALSVLDTVEPEESDQAEAINNTAALLRDWAEDGTFELGAERRDRDGPPRDTASLEYGHRAAAVFMDTWWDTLIDNLLTQITAVEDAMIGGRHDLPNDIGSAFNGGYYGYVRRVLEMELGLSEAPYDALRCDGAAETPDCRAALIASFEDAFDRLGSSDPADWTGEDNANGSDEQQTREQDDAISHTPIGNAQVPDVHWQNRPTFQQVVQPTRKRAPSQ